VVVLDPPRNGAAQYLSELLELAPRRIVYVACDPATLARDILTLTNESYRLIEAVPLDLFPQTAHVETVIRLDRR
jgi:23S rRNA (uracil1939-C5)-methyltransferase